MKSRVKRLAVRYAELYLMLAIPLLSLFLFYYLPFASIVVAFKDYNIFRGVWKSEWIGFRHFAEAFETDTFWLAVRNTLILNAGDFALGFPVPIALAVALNELRSARFRKTVQIVTFLPYFFSMVIVAGVAYQVFSYRGLVNSLLVGVGAAPLDFLGESGRWVFIYWFSGIWRGAGYGLIIYLAALTGVDPELGEAAHIDGAGRAGRIWHVTLPAIRPTIAVLMILNIGSAMTISFDRPYLLGNTLVQDVADVISTHVYVAGLQSGRFDYATAIGLFQSVAGIVLLSCANLFVKRFGEEGVI